MLNVVLKRTTITNKLSLCSIVVELKYNFSAITLSRAYHQSAGLYIIATQLCISSAPVLYLITACPCISPQRSCASYNASVSTRLIMMNSTSRRSCLLPFFSPIVKMTNG